MPGVKKGVKEKLEEIKRLAEKDVKAVSEEVDLQTLRARYLGRSGIITELLKGLRDVPQSERPAMGKLLNQVKLDLEQLFDDKQKSIKEDRWNTALVKERLDVTLPGRGVHIGAKHPITQVMDEIVGIFERMGFQVEEGPEVELDYYNFEALNIPRDHPARDMQDTFYVSEGVVLRTHTSPVQIRVMEKQRPPVKIIAPGKVYRCDSDISHFFYRLSNFRKKLGIKANIEMLYLSNEMFKQHGKHIRFIVGTPILPAQLDEGKSDHDLAQEVKEIVYELKKEL